MFAFNLQTGAPLWQNTNVGPVLDIFGEGNGIAVADGVIYFAGNNRIYALNADTGALVWSFSTLYGTSISPAVSGGVVYVAGSYGPIYALEAHTGALLWQSSLNPGLVHSPPTVAGGVLYVQAYLGGVHALDAATGALLWTNLDLVDVLGTVAVAYGRIYVTSHQHDSGPLDTYALDAQTGVVVWHVTEVGGLVSVAVANGLVYVVNDAVGQIDVFDATTGVALTGFGGPGVYSSPVIVNGTVYFTGAGGLHAYGIAQ
jgi:glucose dehydrogenase